MIYIILDFLLFIFGIFFLTSISEINKQFSVLLFLFLLVLFGGLRYNIGKDWESYNDIFKSINSNNILNSGIEPLFSLLVYFLKSLGFNYLGFLFVLFFISISLKFIYIYKYSVNFFASLLIYFPIQFMAYDINAIRQGFACGILLISMKYLMNRSFIKFIIICFIAVGFHYSAIIFIPFYFLSNYEFSRKSIYTMLLFSFVIGFIFQQILLDFVLLQIGGLESIYVSKILSYSVNEEVGTGIKLGFSTIHRVIILFLFMHYLPDIEIKDDLKKLLLNAYLFSIIIYFLFSAIEIIGARGSFYYRFLDIFIIASFLTIKRGFYFKLTVLTIIFIYSLSGVITNLKIPLNGLYPYDNILFYLF